MGVEIEYYSYASLVEEAMTREKHENCGNNSARDGDFDFTQTESIEEARDFAVNGWDLGLKEYKVEDGILVGGSTELHPSLTGNLPHIQNHIMGFPQEMYQLHDNREYNLPTLDIVVNLAYSAYVDSENSLAFGKSIVSYINAMASTRNIRVTGVFASSQNNGVRAYQIITLKDFDSALVINNIAFAFHPSFFRRLWFSILEGKSYWSMGYGSTINKYYNVVKEELTGGKSDEVLFFKTLNDISNYDWSIDDLEDVTVNVE